VLDMILSQTSTEQHKWAINHCLRMYSIQPNQLAIEASKRLSKMQQYEA